MKKIVYNKLIRDKIPEIITKSGGEYKTRILTQRELEKELKKKLIEESKEILKASKKEMTDELSDLLEIIKSLADYYKLNYKRVEKYQKEKKIKRGGFKKRLFLLWSTKK